MDADYRVKSDRPEPPGWLKRDDLMESVYANSRVVPGGIFLFWYALVLLFKQIGRLIWTAGWELKRRRQRRLAKAPVAVVLRTSAPERRPKGYWQRRLP